MCKIFHIGIKILYFSSLFVPRQIKVAYRLRNVYNLFKRTDIGKQKGYRNENRPTDGNCNRFTAE